MLLMLRLMRSIMFIRKAAGWDDQCDWSTPPDSRLAADDIEETVTLEEQSKTSAAFAELPRIHMSRTLRIPSWLKILSSTLNGNMQLTTDDEKQGCSCDEYFV